MISAGDSVLEMSVSEEEHVNELALPARADTSVASGFTTFEIEPTHLNSPSVRGCSAVQHDSP